jgi:pyruvate/2-oxoglutarate dehydrogenase complex dihydrolipoamide acyltransferase (E2) component
VRSGEVTPPELAGGTFTVSNLGMFGMTAINPVVNMPQAAILGVSATRAFPSSRRRPEHARRFDLSWKRRPSPHDPRHVF